MSSPAEISAGIAVPAELGAVPEAVVIPSRLEHWRALGRRVLGLSVGIAGEQLDPAEAGKLIATQGYARPAPRFIDQVQDATRTDRFRYDARPWPRKRTEHRGLVELYRTLQQDEGETARAMIDNLTFIGEREYAEGAAGLAAYWKQLLDDDPKLQLCVMAGISDRYGKTKSDAYLRERVLEHFSKDELQTYRGRLLMDARRLTEQPEHVRILLVDDWVVSGTQMTGAHAQLLHHLPPAYRDRVEINLLAASQKRLTNHMHPGGRRVPVTSYFVAHSALGRASIEANDAFVSGAHSSVDYDFRGQLLAIEFRSLTRFNRLGWPALASVARPYWHGRYARCPRTERIDRMAA